MRSQELGIWYLHLLIHLSDGFWFHGSSAHAGSM